MTATGYPTRIGAIVQTEHIPSLTGARDIGGAGVELPDEAAERYRFSADMTQVSFSYRKVSDPARLRARIVLANRVNGHRPVFEPVIEI